MESRKEERLREERMKQEDRKNTGIILTLMVSNSATLLLSNATAGVMSVSLLLLTRQAHTVSITRQEGRD